MSLFRKRPSLDELIRERNTLKASLPISYQMGADAVWNMEYYQFMEDLLIRHKKKERAYAYANSQLKKYCNSLGGK